MSFKLAIKSATVGRVERQIRADVRKFRKVQRKKVADAGNVLRREVRKRARRLPISKKGRRHRYGASGAQGIARYTRRDIRGPGKRLPGGQRVGRDEYAALVGPTARGKAFYAKFFEHGTRPRQTRAGRNTGQIIATPFMAPALAAKEDEALRIVGDSFKVFL